MFILGGCSALYFQKIFLFVFRDGEEREKDGEKHQCVVASCVPHTEDLTCTPAVG